MTYMKEDDYLKLANAAAVDLMDNNVPLNDSVTKLAEQFKLNQDQILRLCEATNNTTFNHIFKTKTASDDRLVDFQIADAKAILGNQIKEASYAGDASTVAASDLYELPNQMDQVRRPYADPVMEKVASFVLRPLAKPRAEVDLRTLEKTASYLASEKLSARMTHQDTLTKLAASFKLLYKEQPFEAFEKQAAAVHGKTAEAALSQVRTLLRQPAVNYDWDKLQKTAGYVDTDTPTFQLLQTALDLETKIAAHTQGQALLETQIKTLNQQLRVV